MMGETINNFQKCSRRHKLRRHSNEEILKKDDFEIVILEPCWRRRCLCIHEMPISSHSLSASFSAHMAEMLCIHEESVHFPSHSIFHPSARSV